MVIPEYALELLLAYDGREHFLETGHFLKFDVRTVAKSACVPHGVAYSFTLHAPKGQRLLGFDNAHPVPHHGGRFLRAPQSSDHWHSSGEDRGRPYAFVSVERLLIDYFAAVETKLKTLNVPFVIVD